ncbi:universal stress protein [Billgrantia saliphila]|uniref:universal stress protein n=1 Tax=Billgrantia saliphila TaxID=1848458 RepID=UPI0018CC5CDD|nr:universal stress protein [Halomonas saliphila]
MSEQERTDGQQAPLLNAARVLALLDASRHSLSALAVAVDLASRRQAELVALYVEDMDLMACAAFPFSCEIGSQSGATRPFTHASLEATLVRQRQRVNRALTAAVAGRHVRHRLEVGRGQVASEALTLAGPADVLVMGKAGVTERWGARLGSTSRRLILEAPCAVLLWDDRHPFRPGPLRWRAQAGTEHEAAPAIPEPLVSLFDGMAPLHARHAGELESLVSRAEAGGLLLHRAELVQLLDEDADLLARLPLPILVIP